MSKQPAKKSTVTKTESKKATPAKKMAAAKVVKKKPSTRSAAKKVAAKKGRPRKSAPAKPSTRKPATKSKQQHSPAKAAAAAAASETNAETKSIPEVDVSAPFSGGFTLDDVRSVLDTKKSDTVKKKATTEPSKSKAKPKTTPKPTKKTPIKKKAAAASITDILGFNPKKSSTSPDRDESKVPTKWKPFFRSLIKIRAQLKEALGDHSEETIGASARESSGELSVNSPDAGSESFDRDVALSMVAGEQETLQEVEAAIDRLFEGTYGVCQETGKPIKQTRLKAVPFTRFSLDGQALYEQRGSKGREKVGGVFATLSEASLGDDQA